MGTGNPHHLLTYVDPPIVTTGPFQIPRRVTSTALGKWSEPVRELVLARQPMSPTSGVIPGMVLTWLAMLPTIPCPVNRIEKV